MKRLRPNFIVPEELPSGPLRDALAKLRDELEKKKDDAPSEKGSSLRARALPD